MESKRKSNSHVGLDGAHNNEERGAKRIRLSTSKTSSQYGETAKGTTELGLKLLEQLKNNVDKSGRAATVDFHTLPSRKGNESYYAQTKAPMAFDTAERRLRNHEFGTLSELESYFKRMVQNCKDYYPRESTIYKDAERIRKITTTWMQQNNPAYHDSKISYAPYPTVITEELIASHPPPPIQDADVDGDNDVLTGSQSSSRRTSATPNPDGSKPNKRGRPFKNAQMEEAARERRASSTPAPQVVGYNGLSFQQAQEKILDEMMHEKEDESDEIPKYDIFARLPDRKMFKDYYAVIPHPVSFATLKRAIKGGNTGVSKFTTWDELEEEVSLIWKNARHYNEDGSFVSELADDFEVFFNNHLRRARKVVPEPQPAQKQKIKLKINAGQAVEPAPTPKPSLRMVIKDSPADSPALTPLSANTSTSNALPPRRASTITLQIPQAVAPLAPSAKENSGRARSVSNPDDDPDSIIVEEPLKPEPNPSPSLPRPTTMQQQQQQLASPAPVQMNGNAMAPPSGGRQATPMNGIVPQAAPTPVQATPAQAPPPTPPQPTAPPIAWDGIYRMEGKNAANALITNVHLSTHPGLNLREHYHLDIPASEDKAQQSVTLHLPSTHYYLQVTPALNASIAHRQFKTFAMVGSQRLLPMPQIPGQSVDQLRPLYEARLRTGTNTIEISVISAPGSEVPKGVPAELEKITIHVFLMRT